MPTRGPVAPALREFAYWLLRYRRVWRATFVISIVNPLLFITAMGAGLGRLVDRQHSAYLDGVPYLRFMAPGLLVAAAMQTAYVEAGVPVLQSARRSGNYRLAVATPMLPSQILTGHLLYIACRLALSAALITAATVAYGAIAPSRAPLVVLVALLTGLAFAAPLAAVSITMKHTTPIRSVYRFVLMPLYMYSGTFFPASRFPGWLRAALVIDPLWHGSQLSRQITVGTATAGGAATHAGVLLLFFAVGVTAGRRTYARVLNE